jgi:chromosome segregation ATPase
MLSVTLMFACAGLAVGLTAIWIVTDSSQKVRQETQDFVEDHAEKTTQSLDTTNVKIKNLAVKLAKLEDRLLILSHVPSNTGKQLTSLNEDVAVLKEQLKQLEESNVRIPRLRTRKPPPYRPSA